MILSGFIDLKALHLSWSLLFVLEILKCGMKKGSCSSSLCATYTVSGEVS